MTSMTCPLAGLYAGQLDFSAPHRAKKANTKSKALICRRILSGVTPSWPNGVAFKEVSSPHDCQSTLVFAKTLGRPLLCRHGIAWLGKFDSAVASILVASIVVVSMALLGLVDSNLWWHQFW